MFFFLILNSLLYGTAGAAGAAGAPGAAGTPDTPGAAGTPGATDAAGAVDAPGAAGAPADDPANAPGEFGLSYVQEKYIQKCLDRLVS